MGRGLSGPVRSPYRRESAMTRSRQISPESMQALVRLADALDSTTDELLLRAPASWFEPVADDRVLSALDERECRALLASGEIARIGFCTAAGPSILPVTYALVEGRPVFRTGEGTPLAGLDGQRIALEVDRVDHVDHVGWSVLVAGTARVVRGAAAEPLRAPGPTPWPGGQREVFVVVTPDHLTGRRIERRLR